MNETISFTDPAGTEEEEEQYPVEEVENSAKIAMIIIYVIILFLSLVGNSLIVHLVRTRKNIRKNQFYWLIVNTAVADLTDVITASAFSMPYFIFGARWGLGAFGTLLCKVIPFLLVVSICAAIWTLTVIAVDRYLVIVCLRRRALSSRSVLRSIVVVWLCAVLIGSTQLYKYKILTDKNGTVYCVDEWHEESQEMSVLLYKTEMVVRVVITYAVPLVIMAILYFLIARFLWKRKPPVSVNQQAYMNQVRKRKTVIKMLITVVTVFTLCWLPVHISHVMSEFYPDAYLDIPNVVRWLFYWLAHANATIHPWLFIAFSEHLRAGTKEIFGKIYNPNQMRLRSGSSPSITTNEDPLSRPITPKRNSRTAEDVV